ncbi:hypothetical protein [Streptomyces sp. NPDC057580]|uniref:hypothetical protein n=1 Tax=Streptomyces sp. NPDC057580 TaxID=3346173 RepID=UPI0036866EF8
MAAGTPDNAAGSGATIQANGLRGAKLMFLGAAAGSSSSPVAVTYTDGTSTIGSIGFPNWVGDTVNKFGADLVASTTGRNFQSGYGDTGRQFQLFAVDMPIDPMKTIATVTLPAGAKNHIFAGTVTLG